MVVFLYLSPFVVALGMPFIARSERLSLLQLVGLIVGLRRRRLGLRRRLHAAGAPATAQWLGDALGLARRRCCGARTTLGIRAQPARPARRPRRRCSTSSPSRACCSPLAALADRRAAGRRICSAWLVGARSLFQIVVVTFASYLLWFWLIRHYPATRLASFTLLTPVFGLLAGALLLGEPITARLLVALAAVALGIGSSTRRRAGFAPRRQPTRRVIAARVG